MQYLVKFEYGFSKNMCQFNTKKDAIEFAEHLCKLEPVKYVSIHRIEYDYDATVELSK